MQESAAASLRKAKLNISPARAGTSVGRTAHPTGSGGKETQASVAALLNVDVKTLRRALKG